MAAEDFSKFSVNGKIVLVTGGGAGIGLAYVRLAHARGAKVIIADLQLHKDAQDIVDKKDVIFQQCDVAYWSELENLIAVSKEKFGDVPDAYIANAGIFEPSWSSFWENTETERYAIFDINVNHPIKLTRIAMKALLGANKQGVVSISASIAGYSPQYPAPLYSASKHAVVGFTRSMAPAQKLQGVKVVALCPGIVDTPLWSDHTAVAERFSITDAIWITAETVAEALDSLVEGDKYGGGTILEVSKLGIRVIPEWNIDPPGMVDGKMAEGTTVPEEAVAKALGPIIQKMESERGQGAI